MYKMGKFLGGISLDSHRDSCFKETWGTVFSLYLRDLQLGIPPLYQVISAPVFLRSSTSNANQRTGKKREGLGVRLVYTTTRV